MNVHQLPSELTIYNAKETADTLTAILKAEDVITLDASLIEELDTAGIQVLLRLHNYCHKHDIAVTEFISNELIDTKLNRLNLSLLFNK